MNLRRHKGRRQHMLTLFSSAEMCWFNSPSYLRIFGHCSTKLSREARLWPPNNGAKGSSLREDPEDRNENFLNGCFWSVQFRSWGRSNRYQHPLSAILRSLSLWLCRTLQLSLSLSLSLLSPSKSRRRRRRRRRRSSVFSSSLLFPFSSFGKEVWACPSFLCLCFSLFSTYAWFSSAKPSWKSIFVFWSPRDWHTRQWLLTKKRPQPPTGQDLWSSGLGSSLIVKMVSVRITAPETFFTLLKNYLIWLKRPKIKKNRPIFKKTLPTC